MVGKRISVHLLAHQVTMVLSGIMRLFFRHVELLHQDIERLKLRDLLLSLKEKLSVKLAIELLLKPFPLKVDLLSIEFELLTQECYLWVQYDVYIVA